MNVFYDSQVVQLKQDHLCFPSNKMEFLPDMCGNVAKYLEKDTTGHSAGFSQFARITYLSPCCLFFLFTN